MQKGIACSAPLIMCIVLHLLAAGGALFAQSPPSSYTVESLVGIALEKYEPLKTQEAKARHAAAAGRHLAEWYNPEIGFSAGRKTAGDASGRMFEASVSQRLSFPGKKGIMEEIALKEETRARLGLDEMRLFIRYEVTRLAYEYAYHRQRAGHVRDRLDRLRLINTYMQGRIVISPEKRVERRIIQSKIALLEREVHRIGTDTKAAFARLNLYTALSADTLPEVRVRWFARAPQLNAAAVAERARRDGFLVRDRREALEGARKERKLAERGAYPDVDVSAFYSDEKTDVSERSFGAGVSFPLPLFSRNRNAVEMGSQREKSEEHTLRHAERQVDEQVRELAARYEYASAMVGKFAIDDIRDLEEAMRYTDVEFRRGRVTLATFLEMDAQTHEMLEEIFRSQLDLVNVYTSLLFLSAQEKAVEGDHP